MKYELNRLYNIDCMEAMQEIPDKYFELAIVDPPYGIGEDGSKNKSRSKLARSNDYIPYIGNDKEPPSAEYFFELKRISKHQIIWGCNYYDVPMPKGRIVWDKVNGNNDFSDCEIAACSIFDSVRLFRYMWHGFMQGKSIDEGHIMCGDKSKNEKRIHPNQKPVNLYKWILQRFAQTGWKILDTHVGSASSLIACYDMGFEFLGFELDKNYYEAAQKRLADHKAQLRWTV